MSASRALAAIVVPLYLAHVGYSGLRLGELFFSAALVSLVISTLTGFASDRIGRKPFLVAVPLLVTLAGGLFAVTTRNWILFAAASIGSIGRGAGAGAGQVGPYQPAESAYVTDSVEPRWRNDIFSRLSFASTFGALLGGLLAVALSPSHVTRLTAFSGYRSSFIAVAISATLSFVLALFIVESRPNKHGKQVEGTMHSKANETPEKRSRFFPRKSKSVLLKLWVTNSVNGMAVGMFGPFVTYWLYKRFGADTATIGILYAVTNVTSLGSAVVASPLARRFKSVRTVSVVRLVQALLLVPLALAPTLWVAGTIYVVRMFAQRIGMPLRQSFVLALADPDERSRVAALSNLPAQGAVAASPLLAGYLFDEVSLSLPFVLGGILQFINSVMYYWFFKDVQPVDEQPQSR